MNNTRQNKQRKTVLIVDSDLKIVESLSNHCQAIGLEVWTATDGNQALEILDGSYPNLLMLDVDLPSSHEKSFVQILDMKELNWRVPTILLSQSSDLSSVYRVQNLGAYYVHKSANAWDRIKIFVDELVDLDCASNKDFTDDFHSKSDIL